MVFSSLSVLRLWRVLLGGLVIAGVLFGVPFTSSPSSQCYAAKGKGGGGHAKGAKGHKPKGHSARNKRHGPKRQHAQQHSAKKQRNAKRRGKSRKVHGPSDHISISQKESSSISKRATKPNIKPTTKPNTKATTKATTKPNTKPIIKNRWNDYGWSGSSNVHVDESEFGSSTLAITPQRYTVKFFTKNNGKHISDDIIAPSPEKAKEAILKKHADAVIESVQPK